MEVVASNLQQQATDLLAKMSSELVGHVQLTALARVRVYAAAAGTFTAGDSPRAASMLRAHPHYPGAAAAACALVGPRLECETPYTLHRRPLAPIGPWRT